VNKEETTSAGGREASSSPTLTAKRLRELLSYDRITGEFKWKPRKVAPRKLGWHARIFNANFAGKRAGHLAGDGFVYIDIGNRTYRAHRLAWLWAHGSMPDEGIEHVDGNRANNALGNLRLFIQVKSKPDPGPVLQRSVYWVKPCGLWCTEVSAAGKRLHQSFHTEFEAAVAAGKAAALETRAAA
jgi:hypothetical protein